MCINAKLYTQTHLLTEDVIKVLSPCRGGGRRGLLLLLLLLFLLPSYLVVLHPNEPLTGQGPDDHRVQRGGQLAPRADRRPPVGEVEFPLLLLGLVPVLNILKNKSHY